MDNDTQTIAVTGGPCSGKSTCLSFLQEKFQDLGYRVFPVPEVATLYFGGGVNLQELDSEGRIKMQEDFLRTQILLESRFQRLARLHVPRSKSLVICDRGCMDVKAYLPEKDFKRMLRKNKWDETELRDRRYKAVFHLVTAAEGKEEFYTTLNNKARKETPEQARVLDKKTRDAWIGHPHLRVIGASDDFQGKLKNLLKQVQAALGVPVSLEIERKFLLAPWFRHTDIPVTYQEIIIEQFYLRDRGDGAARRIRKRWQKGSGETYYLTTKRATGSLITRVETEKHINQKQFSELLWEADPNREKISKQRFCFLWKNQYFELDVFLEPVRIAGLTLLEIELTEENDKIELPDFLKVIKEVTEDPNYFNANLAEKSPPDFLTRK